MKPNENGPQHHESVGFAGLGTILKKSDIDERGKRDIPITPKGLVDKLNLDQLAAILAYLDSLKK